MGEVEILEKVEKVEKAEKISRKPPMYPGSWIILVDPDVPRT